MPRHKFEGSHQDICEGPAELEPGAQLAGQGIPQDVEGEGERVMVLVDHNQGGQQQGEEQLHARPGEEQCLQQRSVEWSRGWQGGSEVGQLEGTVLEGPEQHGEEPGHCPGEEEQ